MARENYVTDKKGKKIAVQIPLKTYKKLLADSEELEDIKEFRLAKKHSGDSIPVDQAFQEIEESGDEV